MPRTVSTVKPRTYWVRGGPRGKGVAGPSTNGCRRPRIRDCPISTVPKLLPDLPASEREPYRQSHQYDSRIEATARHGIEYAAPAGHSPVNAAEAEVISTRGD